MEITLKDYETVITDLFRKRPEKKFDFSVINHLLNAHGNPQHAYPVVHVAGTNGKGQVAAKIAFALQNAGYRVGLFISPHLFTYEERITINGEKIPRETIVEYSSELERISEELHLSPNFFESTTCFGFRYFREQGVEIAIIEAGLGGKWDATNVVNPLLSVITSISYDHTEFLGETIEEIAEQKAGFIKPDRSVVVGPRAKYLSIFKKAEELNAPVHVVEKKSSFYDTENQAVAKEALTILTAQFPLEKSAIEAGLKFSLPCRFDKKENVIYDVAHNIDGFTRLSAALEHRYPYRTFRFVIGMSRSKDIKGCLEKIEQKARHVHFVQACQNDSATTEELAEDFRLISTCPHSLEESIEEGIRNAKAAANKSEMIIVCGSFYVMAEAINSTCPLSFRES
ncbi:MAG: Folylpolyglutamate synthase [Chlamydiae bacterium]|nr:Folylpolyglutamate synthase [Chlamydiota bacterium]